MTNVPSTGPVAPPPPVWDARPVGAAVRYAGFWIRTVAAVIDGIILLVVGTIVSRFIVPPPVLPAEPQFKTFGEVYGYMNAVIAATTPTQMVIFWAALYWVYFAFQEASPAQATLGKRALGLRVSSVEGNRLDLAKATLRTWPMYLPAAALLIGAGVSYVVYLIALISCLAVAFSSRKQGLHDRWAGAIVTRNA